MYYDSEVFTYLWLHWVLIALCGLFSCCGAQALGMQTSVVVVHGHCCPAACGIFLDQGSNPVSPALAGGFFTTGPPGKSTALFQLKGT